MYCYFVVPKYMQEQKSAVYPSWYPLLCLGMVLIGERKTTFVCVWEQSEPKQQGDH